jgi:hypothetical protein
LETKFTKFNQIQKWLEFDLNEFKRIQKEIEKVHCALGLSLLRLLARRSIWAGSAWASSPLPEAEELQPTALGGGARSIPANQQRGEAGKTAGVNWCQG